MAKEKPERKIDEIASSGKKRESTWKKVRDEFFIAVELCRNFTFSAECNKA
jgi:hypothetical protein